MDKTDSFNEECKLISLLIDHAFTKIRMQNVLAEDDFHLLTAEQRKRYLSSEDSKTNSELLRSIHSLPQLREAVN